MNVIKKLTINDFQINTDGTVNINPTIFNDQPGLLFVWATWCSHCVRFKPIFEELATKLNKGTSTFPCVTLESAEFKSEKGNKLSNSLHVKGYPTLLWCHKNKVIGEYNGNRDLNTMLQKVCDMYHHCVLHK